MNYKVVDTIGGRYYSSQTAGTLRTEYIPGSWTEAAAGVGDLFFFCTLAAAQAFVGAVPGSLEIWECDVTDPHSTPWVLTAEAVEGASVPGRQVYLDGFRRFWREERQGFPEGLTPARPPEGTLAASRIRINRLAV